MINIDKLTLKFIWKYKWPGITKVILKSNNKTGGRTIRSPDLTKTIYIYGHIVYDKENNPVQREIHSLINRAGSTEYHIKTTTTIKTFHLYLTSHTKIKWIVDQHVKGKNNKILRRALVGQSMD